MGPARLRALAALSLVRLRINSRSNWDVAFAQAIDDAIALLTKLSGGRVTGDCFINDRLNEMAHSANGRQLYMLETGSGEHPEDTARRWREAAQRGEPAQVALILNQLSPNAKRAIGNALEIWMLETRRTDVGLAAEITAMLQNPAYSSLPIRAISARTVFRWRKGLTLPRYPQLVAMLTELSGGRVTADSFMAGSMS